MIDCCLTGSEQFFQLYYGEKKLHFNEMTVKSVLYLTNAFGCIFMVLAHCNNSLWIDMSLHFDTFGFQANQFLLLLLNAACLA